MYFLHATHVYIYIHVYSGPINLKVIGYREGSVQVAWHNPRFLSSYFAYTINASLFDSGSVIESLKETFRREEDPFISIDLNGYECKEIQVTVAVLSAEDESESVTAVVPSCEGVCVS